MYGSRPLLSSLIALSFAALLTACGGGGGGGNDNRPSSNANLTSLLVENALLDPAFASNTTSYDATVTGGTTETRITAFTTDSRARLTIDGNAVASGTASDPISLVVGMTDVDVVVTAEDGTRRTYAVSITRPAPGTEARLDSLALTAGPLLQPFDSDLRFYDASFGYLATTTRVIADPIDPLADSLRIDGEDTGFSAPSELVDLAVGVDATTINIEVTAEDDATRLNYEVEVSRAEFSTLAQTAYIKASNTDAGDAFGSSITLAEDNLLIGAPAEQSLARDVDGNQSDNSGNAVGAAYLYERTAGTWTFSHYLKAANADNGDRFGASIAASPDLLVDWRAGRAEPHG